LTCRYISWPIYISTFYPQIHYQEYTQIPSALVRLVLNTD